MYSIRKDGKEIALASEEMLGWKLIQELRAQHSGTYTMRKDGVSLSLKDVKSQEYGGRLCIGVKAMETCAWLRTSACGIR